MKEIIIKYWKLFLKHWYAIELTVVCFLIAIEVLGSWAGFAAIFLPALGFLIKKMLKA
jgi:hypothetical protein